MLPTLIPMEYPSLKRLARELQSHEEAGTSLMKSPVFAKALLTELEKWLETYVGQGQTIKSLQAALARAEYHSEAAKDMWKEETFLHSFAKAALAREKEARKAAEARVEHLLEERASSRVERDLLE